MTGPPALGNDLGHLIDLSLRTAESTESLLRKLAGTLVLAVTEEFDDAALVWSKTIDGVVSVLFTRSFVARRCPLIRYAFDITYPATSFTISLTNAVLLLR